MQDRRQPPCWAGSALLMFSASRGLLPPPSEGGSPTRVTAVAHGLRRRNPAWPNIPATTPCGRVGGAHAAEPAKSERQSTRQMRATAERREMVWLRRHDWLRLWQITWGKANCRHEKKSLADGPFFRKPGEVLGAGGSARLNYNQFGKPRIPTFWLSFGAILCFCLFPRCS